MQCLNCKQEVAGNFCPNCSQRTTVKRLAFKEGWYDFWARIYGFDGMFPRTLRDLTIRPGVAARRFIEGNRVLYYGPVGYFFLMITIMLLLYDMMGISFVDIMKTTGQNMPQSSMQSQAQVNFSQKIFQAVSENLKIFFFAFIPFQAFAARYIFFRKAGLNFIEHTVLPFYVMGHDLWINIIFGVVFAFTGQFHAWTALITFFYFGYAYSTFMTHQSRVKAFLKGIGVWLVGYVVLVIAMMFVIAAAVVVMGLVDPDALKSWFKTN